MQFIFNSLNNHSFLIISIIKHYQIPCKCILNKTSQFSMLQKSNFKMYTLFSQLYYLKNEYLKEDPIQIDEIFQMIKYTKNLELDKLQNEVSNLQIQDDKQNLDQININLRIIIQYYYINNISNDINNNIHNNIHNNTSNYLLSIQSNINNEFIQFDKIIKKEKKQPQQKIDWSNKSKSNVKQQKELEQFKLKLHVEEKIPTKFDKLKTNYLITSSLTYVNNSPHLGNIIGSVLSGDVYSRYLKLKDYNVLYICGTDEYGTASEIEAKKQKISPLELCNKYFEIQKKIYSYFNIQFNIYGRTTNKEHESIVQDIYQQLQQNDFIEKKNVIQVFCQQCDLFLADRYINGECGFCGYQKCDGDQCESCGKLIDPINDIKDPICSICQNLVVKKESQHIFLKLEELQKLENFKLDTTNWSHNADMIYKDWVNKKLQNRCISRDLKWGISVPDMQNKVFYVWFDAPIGYISITKDLLHEDFKDWWYNDQVNLVQFMAKDNIPFHSLIFPSTLKGCTDKFKIVDTISSTEYLNYEKDSQGNPKKFSKSKKIGVFGEHVMDLDIDVDVFRFYLIINRPEKQDSNFEWEDFQAKNNGILKNKIGNFVNRTLPFVIKKLNKLNLESKYSYNNDKFIDYLQTQKSNLHEIIKEYMLLMDQIQLKQGLLKVIKYADSLNIIIQDMVHMEDLKQQDLNFLINQIRILSALLEPFIPQTSLRINHMIGIKSLEKNFYMKFNNNMIYQDDCIGQETILENNNMILFRKIEDEEIQEYQKRFG